MEAASQLNDLAFVTRNDPKGMYDLTVAFPSQVAKAVEISRAAPLPTGSMRPDLVLLTGLGGSAAGGDFVRALFEESGKVPYFVNRDYTLPAFVNGASLVFACSYSGNTEETLSAYHDARTRGASLFGVTSGGQLGDLCRQDGFPLIQIPGGQPPRTALGFMLMPVVYACERFGLIPSQNFEQLVHSLEAAVAEFRVETPFDQNPCKQIAAQLHGKMGVIYGLGSWQGLVANRWRGQINENSKNLVLHHVFPELNHNEILGWVQADNQGVENWVGLLLEDGSESAKMRRRFEVTAELIGGVCDFTRVQAKGATLLERMLYLALFGDFVSLYLAALNDVDPENIDSINILKKELSSVPN